jgi:methyltransferase-like protein 6
MEASVKIDFPGEEYIEPKVKGNTLTGLVNNFEVDMSEGVAVDMFGISPSSDNEVKFYLFPFFFLVVLKVS